MEFVFRGDRYTAERNDGLFSYERVYEDSLGFFRDRLDNDGVSRRIDGAVQTVDDTTAYLPSSDHRLYAIDLSTRQVRWTFTTQNWVWAMLSSQHSA